MKVNRLRKHWVRSVQFQADLFALNCSALVKAVDIPARPGHSMLGRRCWRAIGLRKNRRAKLGVRIPQAVDEIRYKNAELGQGLWRSQQMQCSEALDQVAGAVGNSRV